jgi:hypothetical protein
MFRSNRVHIYSLALVASAVVLAFVAAFFFVRPQPTETVANAPSAENPSHTTVDLGAGYTLVSNAQGTHIVPPNSLTPIQYKPEMLQKTDIGAGYWLIITSDGGEIVPPPNLMKTQAQPTVLQKTDIGAGYWLIITSDGGQIVPPARPRKTQAQPTVLQKTDIGAGYWLIITSDGGQIVHERSR